MTDRADGGKEFEGVSDAAAAPRPKTCPACGASTRRADARFCSTCGRGLDAEDYFPSDALRASYHSQTKEAAAQFPRRLGVVRQAPRGRPRTKVVYAERNLNGASTTALAFVTYALVPYLGILFCPGALVMGGVGLLRARRAPHVGGARASAVSIVLGVVVLGAQIFLWWILYKIPDWARQM